MKTYTVTYCVVTAQLVYFTPVFDENHIIIYSLFIHHFRFTFVKEYLIEFNQLAMANASGADDMLNRVMTKDNIGIAALLELKEGYLNYGNDVNMPRQQVLVSNVHIHWDPEFKDVKLIQTVMLMHELMNIMQEINPGFMVQGGELICRFCTVGIGIVFVIPGILVYWACYIYTGISGVLML